MSGVPVCKAGELLEHIHADLVDPTPDQGAVIHNTAIKLGCKYCRVPHMVVLLAPAFQDLLPQLGRDAQVQYQYQVPAKALYIVDSCSNTLPTKGGKTCTVSLISIVLQLYQQLIILVAKLR